METTTEPHDCFASVGECAGCANYRIGYQKGKAARHDAFKHKDDCAAIRPGDGDCTCGLTALLMDLEDYDRE